MKLATALLLFALSQGSAMAQEPAPGAVRSPGNASWAASLEDARAWAASQGKWVFIEFDRPQCGNCQRMEALLYPAFDFEALLVPMVPVRLNLQSPEGGELAQRYGVRDAPAILVVTPEGRLIFLMEGFESAPDFYRHAHKELDAYRKFARRIDAQQVARLTAEEALETGRELYGRSDAASALPRLERAVSAARTSPAIRDEARELLAASELDLGRIAASRRTIERLIATTKDRDRRERAELFRAQIPLAENKPAKALALFKKFQKDHPMSPHLDRVRQLVDRLEQRLAN